MPQQVHCNTCRFVTAWVEAGLVGGTHPCSRHHAPYFSKFFSVQPNHLAPTRKRQILFLLGFLDQHRRVTVPNNRHLEAVCVRIWFSEAAQQNSSTKAGFT